MKTIIRNLLLSLVLMLSPLGQHQALAQIMFGNTPPLHVDGKWLKDNNGNTVVLHGVMDTPSCWFNGGRWGWSYDSSGVTKCKQYFSKLYTAITDTLNGAYCNVFRLHLEPAWTNDNSYTYCEKTGDGEANIEHFNPARLKTYLRQLYFPLIKDAIKHGLYVIIRPPGVCPGTINVGGVYNDYLMEVWDIVTQNDSIRKYSGQVSIELANEPVSLHDASGASSVSAMHDFFQPIVDKIRSNGFTGVIWVPGTGYQSSYQNYATNPITGYNIGYAVHVYSGWYGQSDDNANGNTFITNFKKQVPVVETNPIMVTEIDWSPLREPKEIDHYNEWDQPVYKNLGTWATGSTSKWGNAWKAVLDHFGNIGMTLTSTDDYIDIDQSIATTPAHAVPAFDGNPEACAQACFDWYKEYAQKDYPHAAYTRQWTADTGFGKYRNPILNADFPDPDVIRVGDTFYMVSTTMFHFPGATILKSKDLVNWEYCANPLQQIDDNNAYNLLSGANHYAQGQWASSLNYSGGTFYLYFICYGRDGVDQTKNILLTTTDPEGKWDMKYMDDHYYDSGWLFDEGENGDGNVYVACGIGDIYVCKLRRSDLSKMDSKRVLSLGNGLEGSHMYHIGDWYYIYATYGGTEGSQTIFRSKDPMGPYEEHEGRVFAGQKIHQGALVDTPTGEWWTILFKDAGTIGRIPYLEPVKWVDGWPVIGNNGIDVTKNGAAYKKPSVVSDESTVRTDTYYGCTYLPTNDTFTDATLGLQWNWNHNPDASGWSLFEKPGWLRLHTVSVTENLYTARNSLTQRIMGYTPEGTATDKIWNNYGTIRMDISQMQEGDVAGIGVFQDPYSVGAVKVIDGRKYLYSYQSNSDDWTTIQDETQGAEITTDIIYLRAVTNFGTNKARYYYSIDNKTWTQFGVTMDMRYLLSIFVGQRFYIFNYATKGLGGYVDIDWFSTEPEYTEEMYYGEGILNTFTEDDLTMSTLEMQKTDYTLAVGSAQAIEITCTAKSGLQTNVASSCSYDVENPEVAGITGGRIITHSEGTTAIRATYTDIFGNKESLSFNVTVSTFPLTTDAFNPSIYGTGTFTERLGSLKTSQYGFGGWQYSQGLDLSAYNYIVVRLRKAATCQPSFRLFDSTSYWSDPYMADMKTCKEVIIDLKNMISQEGRKVDPSHIYIAGFWTDGTQPVYIKEVFLSNDGIVPVSIDAVLYGDEDTKATDSRHPSSARYNLTGQQVGDDYHGIVIIGGRKYLKR